MNKTEKMSSGLLISAVVGVLAFAPLPALAQEATPAPAKPAATSTNASTNLGVTACRFAA